MRWVVVLLLAGLTGVTAAETTVEQSMALCERADREPSTPLLDRGLALAEDAVAAHPNDPAAHFAVFCNLGKLAQRRGIGWSSLGTVRRLRREIDTTLALAPDHVPALIAKGALLASLPRLLGGDATEAERLLCRALALDPGNPDARRYLGSDEPETLARR